ncbi:MAG: hypothetical protein ACRD1K_12300, partial [Acidimicrobiales bacterium]
MTTPGTRGHSFSVPIAVRQPTERHPDSGVACPACEHVYGRHEGIRTGPTSCSAMLRSPPRHAPGSPFRSLRPGDTSRQANLAVNYLDAFAPAVIAALHPTDWPSVVVLDTTTLFTRGYRRSRSQPPDGEPDDERVGTLKAGTILVALDGPARGARPCRMRVVGGTDAESWQVFFASLAGAPRVVVADLD